MKQPTRMLILHLFAIASLISSQLGYGQEDITFHSSVEAAREFDDSIDTVVIYFSAPWCGSCSQMRDNTFASTSFKESAAGYLWVEVDIDDNPLIAAKYSVAVVPNIVVLDGDDVPIGRRVGLMDSQKLIQFVEDRIQNPTPDAFDILQMLEGLADRDLSDEEQFVIVQSIVEALSDPEQKSRNEILDGLSDYKESLVPNLIILMYEQDLATRAAAGQALASISKFPVRFDPFAQADIRQKQLQQITEQLR